jgi:hypothetical protein
VYEIDSENYYTKEELRRMNVEASPFRIVDHAASDKVRFRDEG